MSETNIEKWGWSEFNSQCDSLLLSSYSHSHYHLYLIYNSIYIHFIQFIFIPESFNLSFIFFLPFLPSFSKQFDDFFLPIHPISYLFHICPLLDNQIFMHVAYLLHCHSIRQQRVKLVLLKVTSVNIFSSNIIFFLIDIDLYIDYYVKCNSTFLYQNQHPNWTNYDFFN